MKNKIQGYFYRFGDDAKHCPNCNIMLNKDKRNLTHLYVFFYPSSPVVTIDLTKKKLYYASMHHPENCTKETEIKETNYIINKCIKHSEKYDHPYKKITLKSLKSLK